MSLAFYLEHHVPTAIANGLRQLQVDVLTVSEDGGSPAAIWWPGVGRVALANVGFEDSSSRQLCLPFRR